MRKYSLPKAAYKRVIWTIKDYPRRKLQYEAILQGSPPPPDGLPKAHGGDPTSEKAIKAAEIGTEIKAIEDSLLEIPQEYRKGILDFIIRKKPFPEDAHTNTYKYWKKRYIYAVAVKLGIERGFYED